VELPNNAAPNDRVMFIARAEGPLRLIVRFLPLGRAHAWERSVYVDTANRDYTVRFADLTAVAPTSGPRADASNIHDILFVVDTSHAKPGASGRLWVKGAALQR
jgi:hypothetical protein